MIERIDSSTAKPLGDTFAQSSGSQIKLPQPYHFLVPCRNALYRLVAVIAMGLNFRPTTTIRKIVDPHVICSLPDIHPIHSELMSHSNEE
jgi:hypothetical protein